MTFQEILLGFPSLQQIGFETYPSCQLKVLFTKAYWKFIFARKSKAFRFWIKSILNFSKKKKYLAYLWWLITKGSKKPSLPFWRRLKLPKLPSPRFLRFLFKAKQRPFFFNLSLFLLFLLPVIGLSVWLGYPILKDIKIHRLTKAANSAFEAEEYRTALLTSQSAHLMKPEDIGILRKLVETAIILKHPRTLDWSQALANHKEANTEDRLSYARHCILLGENEMAFDWLENQSFTQDISEEVTYLQCLLRTEREEEGKFEAFQIAKAYLDRHPDSQKIGDFFWDLCLDSDQPFLIEQGTEHLKKTALGQGERARQATRRLLLLPSVTPEERKSLAINLWHFGKPTLTDAILCLDATYGKKEINADTLFFLLGQEFDDLDNDSAKGKIVDLLNQMGRPETARQLLETNDVLSTGQKERRLKTMRSSLSVGDRKAFRELMIESNSSLTATEKSFFDFLLQDKAQQSSLGTEGIKAILANASNEDLESIRSFIHLAESTDFLLGFIEELEKRKKTSAGIKYLLATCYRRLGNHEALKKTLLGTRMPRRVSDFTGEQQTCMLKASFGQDLSECTEWAESALVKYPQSRSTRYALALCYLRAGDPVSARIVLGAQLASKPPLCPTQRVIGAVVLKKNGIDELARKWAPVEHISLLLEPEKVLLKEALEPKPALGNGP